MRDGGWRIALAFSERYPATHDIASAPCFGQVVVDMLRKHSVRAQLVQ